MTNPSTVMGIFGAHVRRWKSRFSWPAFFLILLALAAIVVMTMAASIKGTGRSWWSWSTWKSSSIDILIIILCTSYLRYEEKFRKWISSRGPRHEWQVRMADLSKILDGVKNLDRRRPTEIQQLRNEILKCIVSGVSEVLDLPSKSLSSNILEFSSPTKDRMVVTARSANLRLIPMEYQAVDAFLPWKAIKDGNMVVEDNYREREGLGPRPYKSVVAIPITRDNLAYGSLSIDCTVPYAFSGRKLEIYYQAKPYISLLALTFGESSPYHECFFNPAHLG